MNEIFEKLVEAAVLAPSGDNMQPWRFVINEKAQTITITLDGRRSEHLFDPNYQFAFVALGAAVENMRRVAELNDLRVKNKYRLMDLSVVVHVMGILESDDRHWQRDPLLVERVTNRQLYDGRVLESQVVKALRSKEVLDGGFNVYWITSRERIEALAKIVGRSDGMLFGVPEAFESFLSKVDFGSLDGKVWVGMPVDVLGVQGIQKWVLKMLSKLPRWIVPNRLVGGILGHHGRGLITSASGVCIITSSREGLSAAVELGRVVQDVWLTLTEMNLAVQPIGSLYILSYVVSYGSLRLRRRLQRAKVEQLLADFRTIVPEIRGDRLAFLLRFGYAEAPLARTGRIPVERVMEVV